MINPKNYSPLFRIDGIVTCLHSEFFLKTALGLGNCLIVFNKGVWHTFIHKEKEQLCQQKGLELFSNKQKYQEYSKNFRQHIAYAKKNIIPKYKSPPNQITKQEFQSLLKDYLTFWDLYAYTEFCYHNLAYQVMKQTNNPVLKQNLDDLGKLKFKGREILNAYIFMNGVLPNILTTISNNYLENPDDAIYLYSDEILNLFDNILPDKDLIQQRKTSYAITKINNNLIKFTPQQASIIYNKIKTPIKKSNTLKGLTANKGKAKGKVVIAPMLTDINRINQVAAKMQHRDILVAQSTTPELVPLCHKAAAIVTDQGGMLSHAAVISRELNIPCIINTKTATKTFKDRDIVEVDAENGIIRKI